MIKTDELIRDYHIAKLDKILNFANQNSKRYAKKNNLFNVSILICIDNNDNKIVLKNLKYLYQN